MGRKSDRKTATLPRAIKRHLAVTSSGDVHKDGVVRRLMIEAHAHEMSVINKRSKSGFIVGEDVDDSTQQALTAPAVQNQGV